MLNVTLAFGLSDIGGGEILVIGLIALLLFGKNLPTVMKNLGKAYGQFKTTLNAASSEFKKEIDIAAEELEKAKREADVKNELSAVTNEINTSLNDEPATTPQVEYKETPALTDTTQPKPRPAPPDSIDQGPTSLDTIASAPATPSTSTPAATTPPPAAAPAPIATPPVEPAPKPADTVTVAEAPKPAAGPISLDQLQKNIAPPKKIPPPI